MPTSRRDFVTFASMGLLSTALPAQAPDAHAPEAQTPQPGAPTAFGTAPPAGPEVSPDTFIQAQKLVEVEMNQSELAEAAQNWRMQMAPLL